MSGRRQSLDYISRDALRPKGYSVSSIPSGCSRSAWTTHPGRVRGGRGARGGRGMARGGAKRGEAGRWLPNSAWQRPRRCRCWWTGGASAFRGRLWSWSGRTHLWR